MIYFMTAPAFVNRTTIIAADTCMCCDDVL